MRNKIVMLVLSVAVIVSLVFIGCAPEAAPPEEEEEAPPAAPEAEVIKWKCTTPAGAANPWHYLHEYLCDSVRDMSGGRMEITLYPVNELYPQAEFYDNVGRGVSEMAVAFGDWAAGINPALKMAPYFCGNPMTDHGAHQIFIHEMGYDEFVRELYARGNMYVAGHFYMPAECFMSTVPIRTMSDYEGLKVRTAGMAEELFEKLGCACTRVTGAEIYTAVQLGTVDAFEMGGFEMNRATGLHEVSDYIIQPVWHCPMGIGQYVVNMDAWNDLPADLQAMLQAAAFESGNNFYLKTRKADLEAREVMIDYGLEVCTLPPEDMAVIHEKAAEVWNEFGQRNEDCAKLVKIFKDTLELFGYEEAKHIE